VRRFATVRRIVGLLKIRPLGVAIYLIDGIHQN
jgi:hypothetical protein